MAKIKSVNALIDHVFDDYRKYDVELSGLFFDFDVKMKEKDIIEAYKYIQHEINGDIIYRVKKGVNFDPETEFLTEEEVDAYFEDKIMSEGEFEEVYEGNCQGFLESFNGNETFVRAMYDDDTDKYEVLSFVF